MTRFLAAIVLLAATAAHAAPKPGRIDVPRAEKKIAIDGKVTSAEWTKAARVPLMDGGQALLLHDGTYLYVGMVGLRGGVGSICTMNKQQQVRVLHASAGLGTALYDRKDGKWALTQGFTFESRENMTPTKASVAERRDYLKKEGWFANTHIEGQLQREFQIRLDGRTEVPIVLSFMSWITREKFDLDVWPGTVVDGCAELDLAGGWTDREYTFAPETWGIAALQ
jgi:hypothetical protein